MRSETVAPKAVLELQWGLPFVGARLVDIARLPERRGLVFFALIALEPFK